MSSSNKDKHNIEGVPPLLADEAWTCALVRLESMFQ